MNLRNINITNTIKKRLKDVNDNFNKLVEILKKNKELEIQDIEENFEIARKKLLSKKTNEIQEIQKECDHKFIDDGRDSHYTYYTCEICGYETRS